MKRWIFYIIVGVLILAVIGFLYWQGKLKDLTWEVAVMVIVAALGPMELVYRWFMEKKEELLPVQKQEHDCLSQEQELRHKALIAEIKEREQQTIRLEKDIELLATQLELLELKKQQLKTEILK